MAYCPRDSDSTIAISHQRRARDAVDGTSGLEDVDKPDPLTESMVRGCVERNRSAGIHRAPSNTRRISAINAAIVHEMSVDAIILRPHFRRVTIPLTVLRNRDPLFRV